MRFFDYFSFDFPFCFLYSFIYLQLLLLLTDMITMKNNKPILYIAILRYINNSEPFISREGKIKLYKVALQIHKYHNLRRETDVSLLL